MDTHIGHFRIVEELGRGGMGVVLKAHEESLNRFVAIKVLGEHLAEDASYVQRFVREAQSAAKLNHPNIVQIYSIGEHEGQHYFVMEYVSGTSLLHLMRNEGRLDAQRAATLILQTASGLHAAHEQGVIHRDIKPANLMIDNHGIVKIADFGLALLGDAASRLTATGMFMGTPGYLSPEQCINENIDHRTDIYSLGVTFYEALTGVMPFKADSPLALIRQIVEVEPPDVAELNPDTDDETRSILAKMMAKDPAQRYDDCGRLIAALQGYLGLSHGADLPPIVLAPAPDEAKTQPPGISTAAQHDTSPNHLDAAQTQVDTEQTEVDVAPTVAIDSGQQEVPEPPPAPQAPPIEPDAGAESDTEIIQPQTRLWPLLIIVAAVLVAGVIASAFAAWRLGWIGGAGDATQEVALVGKEIAIDQPDQDSAIETSTPDSEDEAAIAIVDTQTGPSGSQAIEHQESGALDRSGASSSSGSGAVQPDRRQATGAQSIPAASSTDSSVSRVSPTPVPPTPMPRPRGVAVVAVGEPLLAGEAEGLFENALGRAGIKTIDEDFLPGVDTHGDPTPQGLAAQLKPHARYLLLIRVEYLGDRQVEYMGRYDSISQSRVVVAAVDLESGERIGPGLRETVEYTNLNAKRALGKALQPRLRGLVQRLNH